MEIIDKFLSENDYTHPPGRKLAEKRAVILHWTGVGGLEALNVWKYFEQDCPSQRKYASAHYCIDLDGTVYRFIPDDDVAYHCGSSQIDPQSGRIYTDWARRIFGKYAEDPERNSPNNAAIGIEMCALDKDGNFDPRTERAAAELTTELCLKHGIGAGGVGTHYLVVGWKECPLLWARRPELFEKFKAALPL